MSTPTRSQFVLQPRVLLTALQLLGAVVACGPGSGAKGSALTDTAKGPGQDSIPGYEPEEESCGFVEARRWEGPGDLLYEYARRDGEGDFLSSNPWLDSALTCAGHLPGWDAATVIKDFAITPIDSTDRQARFKVRYSVIGTLTGGSDLSIHEQVQEIVFLLVRTPWGWRIDGPQLGQHILPRAAIGRLHLTRKDSLFLAEVSTAEGPRSGPTLLRPGEDWVDGIEAETWLGVVDAGQGRWELRVVSPKIVVLNDACREEDVRVVDFDRPGVRFAFRASTGLREGSGVLVASRPQYVAPGDSIMFPRRLRGSYQLRASGREEAVENGRVVRNYTLVLLEEDGEHGRGVLVWRGEYGDVAPSVEWIGDLNQDGFPDVLASIPTVGYGTVLRLLLSDDSGEEMVFRAVGESEVPDC